MSSIKEDEKKEIPEIIHDPQTNCSYQRLRFFGKVCISFTFQRIRVIKTLVLISLYE